MNVLILSLGGGGGNVLRSLKTIVQRDLTVTQQTDVAYADRLRQRIATRFLDTNEFSLSDVPPEERLLIGTGTTGRLGSGHNPDVARAALEESRSEVEALLSQVLGGDSDRYGREGHRSRNHISGGGDGALAEEARHSRLHSSVVRTA